MSLSAVCHGACQGIENEYALSHYYVMPFIHTFVLPTLLLKGSVKEQNMFHNYETEKITR